MSMRIIYFLGLIICIGIASGVNYYKNPNIGEAIMIRLAAVMGAILLTMMLIASTPDALHADSVPSPSLPHH